MTATATKPTVESLAAMLKSMQDNMTVIAGALADLAESEETTPSTPTTDGKFNWHGLTESTLKQHAKRHGVNIMGKVTQSRIDQWFALYEADNTPSVSQLAKVESAKGQANGDPWAEFTPRERSAESTFGRPKASEAAEMYLLHPEHDTVEHMSPANLRAFSQAGKPNAQHAPFRRIPLNGNHRRCIMKLAMGTDTPSVKLVVADAVAIAKSAGIDPTKR